MVAVRAEADASNNSSGITLTTNATPQVGDTACLVQWNDWYDAANLQAPTGGLSWTLVDTADGGTNNRHVKTWLAPVTSSGAQSVTVNNSSTDEERYAAFFILVGGVSFDTSAFTNAGASSTAHVAPAVTTNSTDGILICTWLSLAVVNYTMPGSMTPYTERDLAGFVTYDAASEELTSAAATGTRTATASPAAQFSTYSLALKATTPPGPPGTVSYVSASAVASAGTTTTAGTASATAALPTGTASGDRVYLLQSANNTSATAPAGWTEVYRDVQVGPTGTAPGAGTGRRYVSCFYRDYDGAWTMPARTLTSATQNTNAVAAITLRKGASDTWDTPTFSSPGNTSAAVTAFSVTIPSFTTKSSAMLITHTATNDNVTASAQTLTQSGATFANVTERLDGGSATGNDVSIKAGTADVTTGATATLSRTATLSAASEGGTVLIQQTSTAPAGTTYQGATALTATATLTADGAIVKPGAVSLSATATLSPTGTLGAAGAITLSSTATLSPSGVRTTTGTAALTATGALSLGVVQTAFAAVSLPATATLVSDGARTVNGAVALAVVGGLSVQAFVGMAAAVNLSAAVSLSANLPAPGAGALLAATGGLSGNGIRTTTGAVTLAVVGGLSAAAFLTEIAAVALSIGNTLNSSGIRTVFGAVALGATTSLSIVLGGITGNVSLPSTVTLSIAAVQTMVAVVSITATTTLSSNGVVGAPLGVALTVSSSLTVAARLTVFSAVSMLATPALTAANPVGVLKGTVGLTTLSNLLASAGGATGSTNLVASYVLSVNGATFKVGAANLTVTQILSVSGWLTAFGAAQLNVSPALSVAGKIGAFGVLNLTVLEQLTVGLGVISKVGACTLLVSAGLSFSITTAVSGSILLAAAALLRFVEVFPEVDFASVVGDWNVSGIHTDQRSLPHRQLVNAGGWTTAGIHVGSGRS